MGLFGRLSRRSREQKMALLQRVFSPNESTRVLDVGAQVDPVGNGLRQFSDAYPWKHRLTAVNIRAEHVHTIRQKHPMIQAVVGDACRLPWPDKAFDLIYCNAVIEHLTTFERQRQMADEIMRTGRNWFVATPNRWFPFELHLRLPLVCWLPAPVMRRVGTAVGYNHVERRYGRGNDYGCLRLVSAHDLNRLFPDSRILTQRVTVWPETLIAVGGEAVD